MVLGGSVVKKRLPSAEVQKKFVAVVKKTDKEHPTPEDTEELRALLKTHPEIGLHVGDLAYLSQLKMLDEISSTATREIISAGLDTTRQQLGYDDAPILEQIVIQEVLLCWLRLGIWEYNYLVFRPSSNSGSQADFWERRISAAQQRFLRASETLNRIRRFSHRLPALQVNINTDAGQQVNIAGDIVKSDAEEKGKQSHG